MALDLLAPTDIADMLHVEMDDALFLSGCSRRALLEKRAFPAMQIPAPPIMLPLSRYSHEAVCLF
mgnify:CR=1 FL=1